jgi:hypothetical protein
MNGVGMQSSLYQHVHEVWGTSDAMNDGCVISVE